MSNSKPWFFEIPSQVDNILDVSCVPKSATIFYHENRWYYELKTGQPLKDELDQRKKYFDEVNRFSGNLNFALGPFNFESVNIKIKLDKRGGQDLYSIKSIDDRSFLQPIERKCSPIVDIPKNFRFGSVEGAANIPDGATHFCWLNGSANLEKKLIDAKSNEAIMLLIGGLAYMEKNELGNYDVKQINRFQPAEDGCFWIVQRKNWRSGNLEALIKQDRFASSSHVPFVKAQLRHYAFINPNENISIPEGQSESEQQSTENGAFLYLFNENKSPNDKDCLYELSSDVHGIPDSN